MKPLPSHRFLRSSLILMACILCNKLLGFGEKALIARFFGATPESDAILMAQHLLMTGWLVMEEVVGPALIPILQSLRGARNELGLDRSFAMLVMALSLPFVVVYILLPLLFPDQVADLLYPRLASPTRTMLADLWKLFALGCLPFFLTPILQAYAHARFMFVIPALCQLTGRSAMIGCFAILASGHGTAAVGWGTMAYGIVYCALMLVFLRLPGRPGKGEGAVLTACLGRFSYLAFPLVLGWGFSQACQWVDIRLVSALPPGTVSVLTYARKLIDVPVILGAFGLGVVLLPYLSEFHERGDYLSFRLYLSRCAWLCAALYSLITLAYLAYGDTLVDRVYGDGGFGAGSAASVASLVRAFSWGLPVFAVEIIVMQAAFAVKCHWQAILVGMACASLNMSFTLWLFPEHGMIVIPAALVLQKALKTVVLGFLVLGRLKRVAGARYGIPGTALVRA